MIFWRSTVRGGFASWQHMVLHWLQTLSRKVSPFFCSVKFAHADLEVGFIIGKGLNKR